MIGLPDGDGSGGLNSWPWTASELLGLQFSQLDGMHQFNATMATLTDMLSHSSHAA